MTTILGTQGEIGIPPELRQADHLDAGDRFEIERVLPGHYVLSRMASVPKSFSIETGADGLPVIRGKGIAITQEMVREIEALAS